MRESDFGNMSELTMLNTMFTPTMVITKIGAPEIITKPSGYLIKPMNLHTSIGWRNKDETSWRIYKPLELICLISSHLRGESLNYLVSV